ncbi:MAG: YqzL family protein [Ruminococcaceae bacterium]|nr:YqzL family protein [Oscillospiraceae bacterium]
MANQMYWNLFKNLGSVDSYLLMNEYDHLTKEEDSDAAAQNQRIDFEGEQPQ